MKERTILHSDVNNFFASVECATRSELKDKPVAVTGNPEKRNGIILAKNEIAKAQGVKTGEAIWQAQQKCPNLVTLPPHYSLYEKISKELHKIYLSYTDLVEPLGLDECWLDVTPSLNYLQKTGKEIADEIRKRVREKFGFTVSVGVSFSKIFAKLGSDMHKPDATTIISSKDYQKLTYPLPLNSIIGIGGRLTKKFEKMNVLTIGDFVELPQDFVRKVMGKTGVELQLKLRNEFNEQVACYFNLAPPKSIGNGTTTILDVTSREDINKVVSFLSEKIAQRMYDGNFEGSCISVTLKTANFERFHHSRTLSAIRSSEEISEQAMNLIDTFWKYDKPVRAIRVRMSTLRRLDKIEQLSFFNQETNSLNSSIQEIKNKYGKDKIFIASDNASFINKSGHRDT